MTDAEWLALILRGEGTVISRVEVWRNGSRILDDLQVEQNAEVTVDATRLNRRDFKFTPMNAKQLARIPLTVGITELRPYRGLRYRGEERTWPLGVFRLSASNTTLVRDGITQSFSAYDRSRAISKNRLYKPASFAEGTAVEQVIQDLINLVLPGLEFVFLDDSIGTTPALVYAEGSDVWSVCSKVVAQYGCILDIDPFGRVRLRRPASVNDTPTRVYNERNYFEIQSSDEDDPGYNGVKVTGESDESPSFVAYLWDDDPTSPTYARGPYGRRVTFFKSRFLYTQAQVDEVAARRYPVVVGGTKSAECTTFVDPTIDADVVVGLSNTQLDMADRFVVQAFSIPLGVDGDMALTMYKRRNGLVATDIEEGDGDAL